MLTDADKYQAALDQQHLSRAKRDLFKFGCSTSRDGLEELIYRFRCAWQDAKMSQIKPKRKGAA